MIDTLNHTLERTPKALDGVCEVTTLNILLPAVINDLVSVLGLVNAVVLVQLVSIDVRTLCNELTNQRKQSSTISLLALDSNHLATTLNHTEHRCLGLG